jgi:hypothetical protein
MVAIRPFAPAANWTATIVLEKGVPTQYPIRYVRWTVASPCDAQAASHDRNRKGVLPPNLEAARFAKEEMEASPIDPASPTSPWLVRGRETPAALPIGPSDYTAHLGANTGGANGVYWMQIVDRVPAHGESPPATLRICNLLGRAKRRVEQVEQSIEADMLYPLLRWGDIARYRATPRAHLLLAQDAVARRGYDETRMQAAHPLAYAYLERFREMLSSRAAYRRYQAAGPFYSMYDVGPYTLAPIKVVWRRMDTRLTAAVVESYVDPWLGPRPVVPQETCVLIAVESSDEAHYLCALLNSALVHEIATSHNVRGGKSFGTPSMLDFLRIARFDAARVAHRKLAAASREAHAMAEKTSDLLAIQTTIDVLAAEIGRASSV